MALMGFISISNIKKILIKLKGYWQSADVPGKMLIIVFFAPSLIVLFWLLTEIALFVVFTLPGIIIKIIALVILFCIFWSAAVYFYEKIYGMMSEKVIDAEKVTETQNAENDETEKKSRWRRKVN
jgi:glucan phosphoethanolaminetransferase (alkaline phosphatase superfamily)